EQVSFPYNETPGPDWTPLDSVNGIFMGHGHLYLYDLETMGLMLERAGFRDIRRESFMQGRTERLLLDTQERAVESLYIEAVV
ncbi:MAG TPA: hypothetical protein VGB98_21370, partial [Pyrinomonadaceae bacterium]